MAPRLLIAAAASSSGKTLLSLCLARWAWRQGLKPACFKAGPDFIDSQYLAQAAGGAGDNLDLFMQGEQGCRELLQRAGQGSGLALVEGVMGLYDGRLGQPFGSASTAELARAIQAPVLLCLDCRKAGQTLAAVALGLKQAGPGLRWAGVVLNQASGERHARMLAQAIEDLSGLKCLGWMPKLPELALPERHLGLSAQSETGAWLERLDEALPSLAQTLDLEAILAQARSAPDLGTGPALSPATRLGPEAPVLAVAHDAAFHFYYRENLARLEQAGFRIQAFSPLKDAALPQGTRALLLGGGFPESFGEALAANRGLLAEIRERVQAGLPCWAECGGLMLLCREMVDLEGRAWPLAGALAARVRMGRKLQNFGYLELEAKADSALLPLGGSARGHEFHHSSLEWLGEEPAKLWSLRQHGKAERAEGWALPGGGVASYAHLHLASCPGAAERFVGVARKEQC